MTALSATAPLDYDRLRPVRIWLYVLAAFVLVMVLVGGATRLTESGLSITSWKPISGIIPPLSDADWQAEFEAYQRIPQYQLFAGWMGVDEFKLIFWWEWLHRFLGRMLGFAFAIPFVVFVAQRRIPKSLFGPLVVLFLLGGFQGFLGWWMVSSGLSELTSVSQYRLAAHLTAACLLMLALVWVGRSLEPPVKGVRPGRGWVAAIWVLLAMVVIQIAAGALVAGLDAGLSHNTWPLMDGRLIPNGLFVMDPAWINHFENVMTVQFNHRNIAYATVVFVGILVWAGHKSPGFNGVHGWLPRIAIIVLLQVVLGIATLLSVVNIPLALGHQALAFMLAAMVAAYLSDMKRLS
ncbi:COX15/CtaA family protein [Pelagibacterium xiamenense]|uniref:COX15/CtaA family protein n=1 Tax=Pelagibacterium xiamenense TaxID=2901140 RepID=UPI001E5081F0|nr:COX15/CtaA family protein [Pelagibacterium xiamenense]